MTEEGALEKSFFCLFVSEFSQLLVFRNFRNTVPAVSFVCQFFEILRFRYYFVMHWCIDPQGLICQVQGGIVYAQYFFRPLHNLTNLHDSSVVDIRS